ncbi:RT0821/Lpp0805 family surface protein [Neomegalonema sp.]|uniref:RT0821/Lpp0805 family surface protein n=1 Tax=Neomegalonema sp. TaxID=2039713 RepID=UPI002626B4B1|nr:RT0821/Lpp0805 family surface protein [Neomegalonema sp.]MDD2870205.1 RT0821/Lpp0805 family surface protein [Neomegalonema sp.]
MKRLRIPAALLLAGSLAACQNTGYGGGSTGGGAALGTLGGAVAGGLIGNQFGGGRGRTVATIAGILVGGVLGNQIGQYLSQQDQVYAQNTALQSLETRQPTTWSNPETGARGTFTPAPSYFHDQYGRLCTNYQHQIYTAQGQPFTDSGTMCKQDNGDWRTVSTT